MHLLAQVVQTFLRPGRGEKTAGWYSTSDGAAEAHKMGLVKFHGGGWGAVYLGRSKRMVNLGRGKSR